MKTFLVTIMITLSFTFSNAQEVKWYTWKDGYEKAKKENKTMLVFMHAKWCNMCVRMLDKTFTNEETISLINKDYIAIKYDLEEKATYTYEGKEYIGNQLAGKLLNSNQLSIPAMAFVETKTNTSKAELGLKNHEEMHAILKKYKNI